MTKRTRPIIPEPDHTLVDHHSANGRVAAAQARLDANPRTRDLAANVGQLADEIAARRVRNLAAVRKARELTQAQVAETLGVRQADISKLEQRPNLTLLTLARYIEATGGRLRVVAEYDDDSVEIQISDVPA
jgi:DNA-binding XRE family transcriptional regulator